MELKSGGMTETEHQRRERLESFRAAIIAAAELEAGEYVVKEYAGVQLEIPKDGQIQLSSNAKGAWVDAKIWIDVAAVGFPWGDEVANLPSAEELAEALRALLKEIPPSIPMTVIKGPMEVLAKHQGKRSWMDVRL